MPNLIDNLPVSPSDRQGFNRRWYAGSSELKIYRPTTDVEAEEAFQDILNIHDDTPVSPDSVQITCGRHCYEGFVYNENTRFIIDVSGLREFGITNMETGGFYVDVGYNNWDLIRVLNNVMQRTLPAGSCYSVGLGGHITGGGYGLLSRLHGLTVDYLSRVDIIVNKTGNKAELIVANEKENPELFWALKGGGGGQFGLITRYYFDNTPRAPQEMYSYSYTWDWKYEDGSMMTRDDFASMIGFFQENLVHTPPEQSNIWANMHLNHKDAGNISIAVFAFEPEDKTELAARLAKMETEANVIKPLSTKDYSAVGHPFIPSLNAMRDVPMAGFIRFYTFLEGVQQFNGSGPNQLGKYKSAYLTGNWTETMIDAAYAGLTQDAPSPVNGTEIKFDQSLIQVDTYGGKINEVASSATAIPQRSSIMKCQYQTYWDDSSEIGHVDSHTQSMHVDWINEMFKKIYAETGGTPDPNGKPVPGAKKKTETVVDGCYYNYPDVEMGTGENLEKALRLYFGENLDRLLAAKNLYNPNNWFRNAQSIVAKPK